MNRKEKGTAVFNRISCLEKTNQQLREQIRQLEQENRSLVSENRSLKQEDQFRMYATW